MSSCPYTCKTFPMIKITHQNGTFFTKDESSLTHNQQSSQLTLEFTLVHCMGLDKCITTCSSHYKITQYFLCLDNSLCAAYLSLSHPNHWHPLIFLLSPCFCPTFCNSLLDVNIFTMAPSMPVFNFAFCLLESLLHPHGSLSNAWRQISCAFWVLLSPSTVSKSLIIIFVKIHTSLSIRCVECVILIYIYNCESWGYGLYRTIFTGPACLTTKGQWAYLLDEQINERIYFQNILLLWIGFNHFLP